jgi:hypothetical protein
MVLTLGCFARLDSAGEELQIRQSAADGLDTLIQLDQIVAILRGQHLITLEALV